MARSYKEGRKQRRDGPSTAADYTATTKTTKNNELERIATTQNEDDTEEEDDILYDILYEEVEK